MGLRPAKTFRDPDKVPFTRYSKRKPSESYIKAMPHQDLHQYRNGELKDYDKEMHLVSEKEIIVRDNALESARETANHHLEEHIEGDYYLWVRVVPHHIIRENRMIAGAGADRLQKGMRSSFGKPSDRGARLDKGSEVLTVYISSDNLGLAQTAFDRAQNKLSGTYEINIKEADLSAVEA